MAVERRESPARARIFVSYAHEDQDLKRELDKHLTVLRRSSKVSVWSDGDITPGEEWDDAIMTALHDANIILLLVSVDFNATDFIWERELSIAMRRHHDGTARVVPVILRRCDWASQPYARLQALPPNATPVSEYADPDRAYTEIVLGLAGVIDYMNARDQHGAICSS